MDKTITTSVVFPEDLWEQMKLRALQERISLGKLVRRAVTEYLEKKEPKRGRSDRLRGG